MGKYAIRGSEADLIGTLLVIRSIMILDVSPCMKSYAITREV